MRRVSWCRNFVSGDQLLTVKRPFLTRAQVPLPDFGREDGIGITDSAFRNRCFRECIHFLGKIYKVLLNVVPFRFLRRFRALRA